jgi:predicted transposase YdaD
MEVSAKKTPQSFRRDAFFKIVVKDPEMARSFFRVYLPKGLIEAVDWESLTALPTEMESTSDPTLRADIIYSVELKEFPQVRLILIVEHQSSFDPSMATRVSVYAARKIQELQKQLPDMTVIAHGSVVHQGNRSWKQTHLTDLDLPKQLLGLKNPDGSPALMQFGFNLIDLADHAYEDFMTDAIIHAPLAVMKFIDDPDPMASVHLLFDCLAHHLGAPDRKHWLHYFLGYLYHNAQRLDTGTTLIHMIEHLTDPKLKENIMTWAEVLHKEGREEGISLGREEGREEGISLGREEGQRIALRSTVTHQLTRRFGDLPFFVVEELESASIERLEELADQLLDAPSLDSLFKP